ncbi:MAG: sulfatase-like hydrolase/transferase [Rubripirellula sp.]|nr:sulfatase-like hydrolase/transferase [Rubripirellula sp.]
MVACRIKTRVIAREPIFTKSTFWLTFYFLFPIVIGSRAFNGSTAIASEKGRPNFLFILVDDQSPFDLKIYNPHSPLHSPVLNQLAADGMVIDGAHHMGAWVGAVCTPSRHMIMTGRSVWHIPNRGKQDRNPNAANPELVPSGLEHSSLPAVFNHAGYRTMRTCKNGNSYDKANALFTESRTATKRGGTEETGSAWHANQVLDYLSQRETAGVDDPFFIYLGFSHPHDTRDGIPELLAKYGAVNHSDRRSLPPVNDKQPKLPPNYLPKHPFHHGHPDLRDEVAVSGVWDRRDPATIRNELGRELACSENIDRQIGRVLDRLRVMGELENTYVVYTSDHGMAIGRHGLQGKQNLYEHTWRVPMIVKGPGIKPNTRAIGNVYLMDLLATFCDLAGIDEPETNEGLSFRSVLSGERASIRDVLYGVYCGGTLPGMRCVKKGDWKLIKYDVLDGAVRETQLFHLAENPHELLAQHHVQTNQALTAMTPLPHQCDLAENPDYAAKRAELEALLLDQQIQHDDPYRLWDQAGK